MDKLSVDFFSRMMGEKPRTDNSDRAIETDAVIYDHYWGKDGEGSWAACLQFQGTSPVGFVQLDFGHLTEEQFYSLAGYCVIHHFPCLIVADEIYDLDPRYPYSMG